jgi:hypothetical protein
MKIPGQVSAQINTHHPRPIYEVGDDPLIVTMIVALVSTKLPILLGEGFGPFSLPDFKRYGFWSAQHESRADLTMLLGCLYLGLCALFGHRFTVVA